MPFEWSFGEAERGQAVPPLIPGVTGLKPLGQGGMGNVFQGVDATGRKVAVKVSRRLSKQALERFQREAELLGRFQSDAVVRAHSWGSVEDTAYLVCEYVDGETLDVVAGRCPSPQARLELLIRVCRAVGVAHREGVVHRDLKPTNVLVQPSGEVKLIDFGVSIGLDQERMTQTGALLGTPHYMAPEQFAGKAPTPESDVWSLAVVGYELLAGRLPFLGSSLPELANSWHQRPPKLERVGPALNRVILSALEQEPGRRPRNAAAFGEALEVALERDRSGAPSAVLVTLCVFLALASCCGAYVLLTRSTRVDGHGPQQGEGFSPNESEASPMLSPTVEPEVWPLAWEGTLTPEEEQRLAVLGPTNAYTDLAFLEGMASRGHPWAAHLFGLGLVVGGAHGIERDRARGFGLLVHSLKLGNLRAAGDLAPLFVSEERSPEGWSIHGYQDHRAALAIPEDLELAAALAFLGRQFKGSSRIANLLLPHLAEERGVLPPSSVAEAYAVVQRGFESHPELLAHVPEFSAEGVGSGLEGASEVGEAQDPWPQAWSGELTKEEARYAKRLGPHNAHDDLQRLEDLARRGEPRAARFYGLALLVGGLHGVPPDDRRGFGYLAQAVRYGNEEAAGDLAPLFVGERTSPEAWGVYGYGARRAALELEEDLDLAAALAFLGTQAGEKAASSFVVLDYLHDEQRVPIPASVAEAYRTVQQAFESKPRLRALAGK